MTFEMYLKLKHIFDNLGNLLHLQRYNVLTRSVGLLVYLENGMTVQRGYAFRRSAQQGAPRRADTPLKDQRQERL